MFDCVTLAASIAAAVPRVEIGFTVVNSTFRNPAMTAKAAGTIDAISGGRLILGLGAGFKQSEALAFGQPYPALRERMAILEEHFEIISRLTRRDEPPFDYRGKHAWVEQGINGPADERPRPHPAAHRRTWQAEVTFRIAARFCDELNINLTPVEIPPYLEALARALRRGRPRSGDDPASNGAPTRASSIRACASPAARG